jgi:uncharacterized protein (DUF433 family)
MGTIDRPDLHRQIDLLVPELLDVVERSPDVVAGLPVFRGTRVPARALLDYVAAGDSLDTFLDDFPSVHRVHAQVADDPQCHGQEPDSLGAVCCTRLTPACLPNAANISSKCLDDEDSC